MWWHWALLKNRWHRSLLWKNDNSHGYAVIFYLSWPHNDRLDQLVHHVLVTVFGHKRWWSHVLVREMVITRLGACSDTHRYQRVHYSTQKVYEYTWYPTSKDYMTRHHGSCHPLNHCQVGVISVTLVNAGHTGNSPSHMSIIPGVIQVTCQAKVSKTALVKCATVHMTIPELCSW